MFFRESDYGEYLKLLDEYTQRFKVDILAYCLMPNHVHLIATPHEDGNLAKAIGETHRNYTRFINRREQWNGYLWQGRFSSYVLDGKYLLAAARYILLNPVKAGIVHKPWEYAWSSAAKHVTPVGARFPQDSVLRELIADWKEFLAAAPHGGDVELLRQHVRTGRPLGNECFIEKLESLTNRSLKMKRAGRRKKKK